MSGCSRRQYEWLFSDLPSVLSAVSTDGTENAGSFYELFSQTVSGSFLIFLPFSLL